MAIILIIEERRGDREALADVLRAGGHDVYEASGADEAERSVADLRPDLIIAGILMPTADGATLIRRLRERGSLRSMPVLFHAPTYHAREAWALAQTCGVGDIVTAPATPESILAIVTRTLDPRADPSGGKAADQARPSPLTLVGAPAARRDPVDMEEDRMAATLEAAEQLAVQGYPLALLNKACTEARRLTLAQYALIGLLPAADGAAASPIYACGLEHEPTDALTADLSGVEACVAERRILRRRNNDVRHPHGVVSLLTVPVASPARVYGWLSLRNKLGSDDFSDADVRVAVTLARQAGVAYENATHIEGLERRLSALETKLREAADRAERIREEERARLAHALHGQLGQSLTELRFDLYALAGAFEQAAGSAPPDIGTRLQGMLMHVDETVLALRAMANQLRPMVLDRLGLVAAIQNHADDIEKRTGLRCRVDVAVNSVDLDEGTETSIFQIVQEALTNVQRHAAAGRVVVTLKGSPMFFTVSIADNGRGISPAAMVSPQSLGLAGMRERAALLGGTLDVERRRPSGTVIRLTIPAPGRRVETRQPS